jgi:hydrogen peroxide-dependent heme synthase
MEPSAQPPVTLEGWYASHQAFTIQRQALRIHPSAPLDAARSAAADVLEAACAPADGGWSAVVRLVGSLANVMFVHFRPTLDALAAVEEDVARLALLECFRPTFAFLSVTEVGLYHLPDTPQDEADRTERLRAERESEHTQRRLYPALPADMPFVSFYPTSKRRETGQNWYTLPLKDRCDLMRSHGLTGRRHAGQVRQIITGAIGFDRWEWGVTLFAADPLALKRVVTDMRYDETSAKYADFGDFFVGRVVDPRAWALTVGGAS